MWRKMYFLLPIMLICLIVVFNAGDDVVMSNIATRDQARSGRLCIPSEDVEMALYRVHDDCACCYLGLYNGGRVMVQGIDLSTVGIDSIAHIWHEDVHLVLECVELMTCVKIGNILLSVHGVVHADGDVLIMRDCFPFVKVWRMTLL